MKGKQIFSLLRMVPAIGAMLMLAATAISQESGEREAVLHALTLFYGVPMGNGHRSFAINRDYVLLPSFDQDGLLLQVAIQPKSTPGPHWVQLTRLEFDSLLATLNSIKQVGVLEEEFGGKSRSAYTHVEQRYSGAYVATEEIETLGQPGPVESASVFYLHPVAGTLRIVPGTNLDPDSFSLVCVNEKLYKAPGSEWIKLQSKPGERQTALLAGPMDDGCTPDQALYEKAIAAVKEKRLDLARLDLCTLINTYPDSEYAGRAKLHFGEAKLRSCANTEWSYPDTNF